MEEAPPPTSRTRTWIARGYSLVEDVVYVGLGLVLAALVLRLLGAGFVHLARGLGHAELSDTAMALLDQVLLILLVVELLYTVQVSFRVRALLPEPFLLVGLISAIRRLLLLTAEIAHGDPKRGVPISSLIELAVLGGLVVALAGSLVLLRRNGRHPSAHRRE
jgi:phosphate starvation-inducible membrane PsiE